MLIKLLVASYVLRVLTLSSAVQIKSINVDRTLNELKTLASFNDLELPAVQRIVFTKSDIDARVYIRSLMEQAGLVVREDPLGNIFGRWQGKSPHQPAVGTGSHFDAIPYSGMYDGTFGVIGAIEAIRALRKANFTPHLSIDVIAFTSEEPTRFGVGCLGSRGLSGVMSAADFTALSDEDGVSFDDARAKAGYNMPLTDLKLASDSYAAFVELHIEQAPSLEDENIDIGIVQSIAAPASLHVQFTGDGGHAGGLLMPFRSDAGLAGAELALEVEKAVLATASIDTVGTTGTFKISPGAINSVPRVAQLGIDVRDTDKERRDNVIEHIKEAGLRIAQRRKVKYSFETINADDPAQCSDAVIDAVEESAKSAGLSSKHMVSRAYHDSLFMARLFPTAMIFVPCKRGISHNPDEYVSPEAIQNGVITLANTLARLAALNTESLDDVSDEL